jgi:hypothetical protein
LIGTEVMDAAYEYIHNFVDEQEAEINGFSVESWCKDYLAQKHIAEMEG